MRGQQGYYLGTPGCRVQLLLHVAGQIIGTELTLGLLSHVGWWWLPATQGSSTVRTITGCVWFPRGAGGTEDEAANEGGQGGEDAQVESFPNLKLHAVMDKGVVEVTEDHVDIPHHRDEAEQSPNHKGHPSKHSDPVLGRGALGEDGASHPHHANDRCQQGDSNGCGHQCLGYLDVSRQAEQRAVDVTLGDARAIGCTLHPDSLGEANCCNNARADVGVGSPAGQEHGYQGAQQAQEPKDVPHKLEAN